mgnify:CR=1 FL=1
MRKKRTLAIAAGLSALMMACAGAANTATATPTGNSIYVDGKQVNGAAYMINSNNYFKLRDIAAMVNGSAKQFEVSWNQNEKRIDLTTNKAYTVVGGELALPSATTKTAKESTAVVYKDGTKAAYTGYTIADNNYYKLRELCKDMDIGVKYDNATKRVDILTTVGYGKEEDATTPVNPTPTEPTTPEQPTTPSKPTTGSRRDDVGPRDTDLRQVDDKGIKSVNLGSPTNGLYVFYPSYDRYSAEYQNLLDTCGEEIITKTIRYYTYDMKKMQKSSAMYNFPVEIDVADARINAKEWRVAKTVYIDAAEGTFEIAMPKSLYEKILAGGKGLMISGTTIENGGGKTTVSGQTYDIVSNYITATEIREEKPTQLRIPLD